MKRPRLSRRLSLATMVAATGCGVDSNPYGPPFLTSDLRVAGGYKSTSLVAPGGSGGASMGGEMRISLGRQGTSTGTLSLPGGSGASGVSVRFTGRWESSEQGVVVTLDPTLGGLPATLLFDATFFESRVELVGVVEVEGRSISVLLVKHNGSQAGFGGGFS